MCLIGLANEADVETVALVDTGAQESTIVRGFTKHLGLKVRPLKKLIRIEGTGGSRFPYSGFVEVI